MTDLAGKPHGTARAALLLGLLAVIGAGCTSSQSAVRPLDTSFIVPGETTKHEVYQGLGLPDTMFFPGFPHRDRSWYFVPPPNGGINTVGVGRKVAVALFYTPSRGMGMALDIGSPAGRILSIAHHHIGLTTVVVLLDEKERVIAVHPLSDDGYLEARLWPFGA